jgi:DNA-binding NarL/FixJ family response regulator
MADGLSDLQIAAVLFLDDAAVRNHARHILSKLNITRAQVAAYIWQHPFDAPIADLPSPAMARGVIEDSGTP